MHSEQALLECFSVQVYQRLRDLLKRRRANSSHLVEVTLIGAFSHLLVAALLDGHLSHLLVGAQHQLTYALVQLDVHFVVGNTLHELDDQLAEPALDTDLLNVGDPVGQLARQVLKDLGNELAHFEVTKREVQHAHRELLSALSHEIQELLGHSDQQVQHHTVLRNQSVLILLQL